MIVITKLYFTRISKIYSIFQAKETGTIVQKGANSCRNPNESAIVIKTSTSYKYYFTGFQYNDKWISFNFFFQLQEFSWFVMQTDVKFTACGIFSLDGSLFLSVSSCKQ